MQKPPSTTSRSRRRHRRQRQLDLDLRRHGGRRRGAGRKPNGARAGVSHRPRGPVTRHTPVHVTLKVADDLPNLRSPSLFAVVRDAIYRGADRFGLRVIHFCVLRGHLHLIVEAESVQALARGMQGLTIRLAKQINKALSRRGKVFVDRYDSHVLRTPSEARACLNYVIKNQRRHAYARGQVYGAWWVDPCSSGDRFTGFEGIETTLPDDDLPIGRPQSWLLKEGWMRAGCASGGGRAPVRRRRSVSQVPGPRQRTAQRARA
jgi:REP element-mobilizing transposase RayT